MRFSSSNAGPFLRLPAGKFSRSACRVQFLAGSLDVIASWQESVTSPDEQPVERTLKRPAHDAESIAKWLCLLIAHKMGKDVALIKRDQLIARYGFDSLTAIELMHELESAVGVNLPMGTFLQDLSIDQLATLVASQLSTGASAVSATTPTGEERSNEEPLSYGQRAMWFLYRLAPESPAYNIAVTMRIGGAVDVPAIQRSFHTLVARHGSLRSTFDAPTGQEPVRHVHDEPQAFFTEVSAADWSRSDLSEKLVMEAQRPFKLEEGPPIRVSLYHRQDHEHILLLVVHHIAADFWSLTVLMHEFGLLYKAEREGRAANLGPLPLRYRDYVNSQAGMLASSRGDQLANYWTRQLAGDLPLINLPADFPRPAAQTFRGVSVSFQLTGELTQALKELGQKHGATLYMTLLAAFQVLISRYTGQDDIIVGSPTSGRSYRNLVGLVGYFVNPVCLRADLSGNPTFEEFLGAVRQTVLAAMDHQDYPFARLVERLQPERDPSRSPVFQVMFVLQKTHLPDLAALASFALGEAGARIELEGLPLESMSLEQRVAQFDLTLMVAEQDTGMVASLQYNTDLFKPETIQRMAGSFQCLLKGIVHAADKRVKEQPLLDDDERKQLLVEWNNTASPYPADTRINEFFEQQCRKTPDTTALVFRKQRLTYKELNAKSNQLARYLRKLGVGPEHRVGVCLERNVEMLVALLGVLKAGAAYVPLDPAYPVQRLSFMLKDSKAELLLTQQRLLALMPVSRKTRIVCLDTGWLPIECETAEDLRRNRTRRTTTRLYHLHLGFDGHSQRRGYHTSQCGRHAVLGARGIHE